jgi:hypothetical protein
MVSCPCIRPDIPHSRASGYDRVQAGIGVSADRVADDVDSAGSSGVADTPTFSSAAAANTAPTTSTPSPRRSRRQRLSRSLDVPQRRDQVDEADVAGSVCLVLSERAFRKPSGYR